MSTAIIACGTGGAAEVIAATNQAPSTSPTKIPIAIVNPPHRVSNIILIVVKHQEMCTVWTTMLAENRVSNCLMVVFTFVIIAQILNRKAEN